ncbi:hypothetical protein DL93DRAFT_2166254 [Clavulina sp. PMI_390]|nr:hypothetical protein DL93DRAFT_2166254 [Clavulina sp. PMI_390]
MASLSSLLADVDLSPILQLLASDPNTNISPNSNRDLSLGAGLHSETNLNARHLDAIAASPSSSSFFFHPLAAAPPGPPELAPLFKLLAQTDALHMRLSEYSGLDSATGPTEAFEPDARIVALLREHMGHARGLEDAKRAAGEYERVLRGTGSGRSGVGGLYGEDMPMVGEEVGAWAVGRMETLIAEAGLAVYRDELGNNKTMFTCGGKLVVLDMTFITSPAATSSSTISTAKEEALPASLESLHLTYEASPAAPAVATAEDHLPKLLSKLIRDFLSACASSPSQAPSSVGSPTLQLIPSILMELKAVLQKVVYLDELASSELPPKHGVRWLREVGNLACVTEEVSRDEAKAYTTEEQSRAPSILPSLPHATFDVLLRRGHGVALPHLRGVALSFLVGLSPRLYLALSTSSPKGATHHVVKRSGEDADMMEVDSKPANNENEEDQLLEISLTRLRHILRQCMAQEIASKFSASPSPPSKVSGPPADQIPSQDGLVQYEQLFTTASLSIRQVTHASSIPVPFVTSLNYHATVAKSKTDITHPFFSLLHPPGSAELELPSLSDPKSVQDLLQYEFPQHSESGLQWYLDLHTCQLQVQPGGVRDKRGNPKQGTWMPQSTAAAISAVVGVTLLDNFTIPTPHRSGMGVGMGLSMPMHMFEPGEAPYVMDDHNAALGSIGMGMSLAGMSLAGINVARYSWFDCLVDPGQPKAAMQYRTTVKSTGKSSRSPTVRMTYAPRVEPGFQVSHIPVQSMRQVYAILEILRDQLWIVDFLQSARWEQDNDVQNVEIGGGYVSVGANGAGEEDVDLDSLLSGNYIPQSIPCTLNVFYATDPVQTPDGSSHQPRAASHAQRGSVHLMFAAPLPGSPRTSLSIAHDLQAPLGVRVTVVIDSVPVDDKRITALQNGVEQFVRRGGGVRVVGWLWDNMRRLWQ